MIIEWRHGYPRLDPIGVGFAQELTCSLVSECAIPIFLHEVRHHATLTAYMEASIPCHVEIEHWGQCPDTACQWTRRLSMTIDCANISRNDGAHQNAIDGVWKRGAIGSP